LIAAWLSAGALKVTKAKPRGRPVSRSVAIKTSVTVPEGGEGGAQGFLGGVE